MKIKISYQDEDALKKALHCLKPLNGKLQLAKQKPNDKYKRAYYIIAG